MAANTNLQQQFGNVPEGNYAEFAADGTLRMHGTATVWDDLAIAASAGRVPAVSAPGWTTWNYGIAGGVEFAVLGFGVDEYYDFTVQSTHSMKLLSELLAHIHYGVPSNDAGKKFKFQLDVIAAGVDEQFAVPTGSPFTAEHTLGAAETGYHKLLSVAEVPGVNTTVSTLYVCKLTRIAASSAEYGSDVYVLFNDAHISKDDLGSQALYTK